MKLLENVSLTSLNQTWTVDRPSLQDCEMALASTREQLKREGHTKKGHLVCVLAPYVWACIRADLRYKAGGEVQDSPVSTQWPVGFCGSLHGVDIWESNLLPDADADHVSNFFVWIDESGSPIRYRADSGGPERRTFGQGEEAFDAMVIQRWTSLEVTDYSRMREWVCPKHL